MMIASPTTPVASKFSFGGHESFPFRLGWLRKGVVAAGQENSFNAPDAVVKLGVGKNMVRSIRTWCLATQMLEEEPFVGTSRVRRLKKSAVAEVIFEEGGDPFMEDAATLWLLHWLLVTNSDRLSLWRCAFMESRENEFSKGQLVDQMEREVKHNGAKAEPSQIARDVDVFIRTYLNPRGARSEEDFSCPLTELNLIAAGGGDRYTFIVGPKAALPPEIFGFALVEYLQSKESDTCSLSDATYFSGSPGQAFKLDEDSVVGLMQALEKKDESTWLVDVHGPIRRIGVRRSVDKVELLRKYYRGVSA
jgi:hypothetical protein